MKQMYASNMIEISQNKSNIFLRGKHHHEIQDRVMLSNF